MGMGTILVLLLSLNAGGNQHYSVYYLNTGGAGVWLWLDSFWVLPTLAIALGLQGIIDHVRCRFTSGLRLFGSLI